MAFHQFIQRILLLGADIKSMPSAVAPQPPPQLLPLIAAVAAAHRRYDQSAIEYGNRYRSGFWAIYLLSAVSVLFAAVPLALGWDSPLHALHPYAGLWAIGEVAIIGSVTFIYWYGQRRDLRVFDPGQHLRGVDDIATFCASTQPLAQQRLLKDAWLDPHFISAYAQWAVGILEHQLRYHYRTAIKQSALRHRIHAITAVLFGLTANGNRVVELKAAIEGAVALILEEHQDWHLVVRPHHLPLA